MKKYIFLMVVQLGLAPLVAGIANAVGVEDAVPVHIGALKVYPTLEVGEKHNDNIFAQEKGTKSSLITTVSPAIAVVLEKGVNRIDASYRLDNGSYLSSHNDDYTDHFVSLNEAYIPTRRLNISAWGTYSKAHDPRGSTFTGTTISFKTPDRYHESVVGAKVQYGVKAVIGLKAEYTSKRYENHLSITKTRELDTTGGIFSLATPIAPKTIAVFEARYKRFNYKELTTTQNLDSTEQTYLLGLDWQATAKTSGTVRVGYLRKRFTKAGMTNNSQPTWELTALWEPLSYSRWQLTSSFAPVETEGTGHYSKSARTNLVWTHEWSSRFSHHASIGYSQDTYEGLPIKRKDKLFTTVLGMDYQLLRWLSIGADYDFTNRNSNAVNSSYRQNTWLLRVHGTL